MRRKVIEEIVREALNEYNGRTISLNNPLERGGSEVNMDNWTAGHSIPDEILEVLEDMKKNPQKYIDFYLKKKK